MRSRWTFIALGIAGTRAHASQSIDLFCGRNVLDLLFPLLATVPRSCPDRGSRACALPCASPVLRAPQLYWGWSTFAAEGSLQKLTLSGGGRAAGAPIPLGTFP